MAFGVKPWISLHWQQNCHCFSPQVPRSRSWGWEGDDFSSKLERNHQMLREREMMWPAAKKCKLGDKKEAARFHQLLLLFLCPKISGSGWAVDSTTMPGPAATPAGLCVAAASLNAVKLLLVWETPVGLGLQSAKPPSALTVVKY